MFVGTLLMEAAWVVVLPPFRGIDEVDHAFRASAVAHGQWHAGPYTQYGRGRLVRVPVPLIAAASAQCAALHYTRPYDCRPKRVLGDGMGEVASGAGGYNPVFYWVVGTAGLPFSGAGSLYAMRAVTALACAILIMLGAWSVVQTRAGPWSAVGLLVALSPVAFYSMTVVSPNGVEIAAAVALWASVLALGREQSSSDELRLIAVMGVSGFLLGLLRGLGPGFACIILAVGILVAPRRIAAVARRHRVATLVAFLFIILGIAGQQLWPRVDATPPGIHEPGPTSSFHWIMPFFWLAQMIAVFPFRDQLAPGFVYPTVGGLLIALVVLAVVRGKGSIRLALLALIVGTLALPLVLTAATYAGRGVIWQGRYGLPLAVGVPIIAGIALGRWRPERWRLWVALGAAATAICNAAGLVHVLADERGRSVSVQDSAWHAPWAAAVVVLVLVAWAAFTLPILGRGDPRG